MASKKSVKPEAKKDEGKFKLPDPRAENPYAQMNSSKNKATKGKK